MKRSPLGSPVAHAARLFGDKVAAKGGATAATVPFFAGTTGPTTLATQKPSCLSWQQAAR